jgi:cell division septation protein DedD
MPDRMPRAAGEAKPRRSRLLLVGVPVFSVFAAFGIIVWLAYQEDARVPLGEPPLITAIATPYKIAPDDPGGRQVPDQGEINRLLRDGPEPLRSERVLPLPEEPRRPVVTVTPPEPDEETPVVGEATPPTTPGSGERAAEDADARREAETALARLLADVGPAGTPTVGEAAEPAVAAEAEPVVVPAIRPATKTAPTTVLGDPPPAAAPVEGPSREADEALARLLAEIASVSETGEAVGTPPGTVAAPARASTGQPPGGSRYRVQLAAVREQDDAGRAWKDLADRLGPLVADYEPFYERAETSNGVFTRIQLGPFASEQAADRLCVEVQRQNASCFVVSP